jgi:hypothetical protein
MATVGDIISRTSTGLAPIVDQIPLGATPMGMGVELSLWAFTHPLQAFVALVILIIIVVWALRWLYKKVKSMFDKKEGLFLYYTDRADDEATMSKRLREKGIVPGNMIPEDGKGAVLEVTKLAGNHYFEDSFPVDGYGVRMPVEYPPGSPYA